LQETKSSVSLQSAFENEAGQRKRVLVLRQDLRAAEGLLKDTPFRGQKVH
jgi:hypothetical protein